MLGMLALMCPATYSSEKSRDISAVHRPIEASTTMANVAYRPRTPLSTRSDRRDEPPANDTVVDQADINRATQSDNSPMRITLCELRPCSLASPCTSPAR